MPEATSDPSTALKDRRILLTRPADRLTGISQGIRDAGGIPLCLPLIRISPVTDPEDVQRVKTMVLALDRYDMAIFVSTNAAELGMDWIDRYWPQLPQGLEAFTVGPGTARVLSRWSWPVHYPTQGVTSEALLSLPELQQPAGKRALLFRGKGGRELIAGTLRDGGAEVETVELYTRTPVEYSREELTSTLLEQKPDALVVTSAQILETFVNVLQLLPDGSTVNSEVKSLPLLVPSDRVAALAREQGFSLVINAGGAGDEEVMQCLIALFGD